MTALPGYAQPPIGTSLKDIMEGPAPMTPAEIDALYETYQAAAAGLRLQASEAGGPGMAQGFASEAALVSEAAQAMPPFGAAALAGSAQPCAQPAPGGGWNVGVLQADGVTFAPQYFTEEGAQARRLAYGWNSPGNGLADVRARLGISIGQIYESPIS